LLVALLSQIFGAGARSLHQGVQRRVIHGLSPFTGYLRRLLIRAGGRYGETELLGKTGRNLLVIADSPSLPQRAAPTATSGIRSVINDEFYLA
jgi:hypothetical protein